MGAIRDKLQATAKKLRISQVDLTAELTELVDGEPIFVRQMNAAERGDYEASQVSMPSDGDEAKPVIDLARDRQQLLVRTICDPAGVREYADDDIPAVSLIQGPLADAIYEAASELNGLGKSRKAAAAALKKLDDPRRAFARRLCLVEGRLDIDGLLERLPADLFEEWLGHAEREPWGGAHEDLRFGILASLLDVANAGSEARAPADFFSSLKRLAEENAPSSQEQLQQLLRSGHARCV